MSEMPATQDQFSQERSAGAQSDLSIATLCLCSTQLVGCCLGPRNISKARSRTLGTATACSGAQEKAKSVVDTKSQRTVPTISRSCSEKVYPKGYGPQCQAASKLCPPRPQSPCSPLEGRFQELGRLLLQQAHSFAKNVFKVGSASRASRRPFRRLLSAAALVAEVDQS